MIEAVDPDTARREADAILGQRRFESDPAPRPLRGVLVWIEDHVIEPVGRAIAAVLEAVPWPVWVVALLLTAALLVAWAVRTGRGQAARARSRAVPVRPDAGEDPAALEREAEVAEGHGDFERAVRLRFRAGLLRLGRRGAIAYQPSVTTTSVRARLRSAQFDDLATTFEEVAYGERVARQPDAGAARSGWPDVVAAAPARERSS